MVKKKTTRKLLSTGPRTAAGKKIASLNATRHGLTAKNWLNEQEQERYQSLLDALTEEYEPQTPTENLLVERVANIATRLSRFQSVENSLFALAREKAADFENVMNSFELDQESASRVAAISLGILDASNDINNELFAELLSIKDLDNISGYGYVREHLPEIRKALFRDCRKAHLDISDLIGGRASGRKQNLAEFLQVISIANARSAKTTPVKTDDELDESGFKVSAADIVDYIRGQYDIMRRRLTINKVAVDQERRTELLISSAMPNSDEMDRLMRYQTNLDRQLSKAWGELLHIIDRRKTTERYPNY